MDTNNEIKLRRTDVIGEMEVVELSAREKRKRDEEDNVMSSIKY